MATLSKHLVYDLAKTVGQQYGLPPVLLMAMAFQESSFDREAIRLEQRFLQKYVKGDPDLAMLDPTVQVLLATSWGLMQTMGEALYRMRYFVNPHDPELVVSQLKTYLLSPQSQLEYGARWLLEKMKRVGSLDKAIIAYNGSPAYLEVIARHRRAFEKEGFA